MSVEDTIARPYAEAIFEFAMQNNGIDKWKNFLIIIQKIASYKKVKNFLSGSISPEYLSLIFITISGDLIDKHAENLIRLLAENQRFKVCTNILEQFLRLEAYYKNVIIIELISAFPLKEKQISIIRKTLEKLFLKKTKFMYKVVPDIISGIIIKVNNTVFDLSIQNHLKQLSDSLNF